MKNLSKNKVSELREMALGMGIEGYKSMKKQDLINAISSEINKPTNISSIIDVNRICTIFGRSGVWVPIKMLKSKGFAMRFMSLLDVSKEITCFRHSDVFCLGDHPDLVSAFDVSFLKGHDIEMYLTEKDYPYGKVKKYTKIYDNLCKFIALTAASTE